jgi:lysophospholipase L1-like esterase
MLRSLAPLAAIALAVLVTGTCAAADGPTPYPDPKDEAAWPGQGPIRNFPYMIGERKAFWNRRQLDQGTVVFVGDSLIGNWSTLAKGTAFPAMKVANRGVGGDTSRGILFRFQDDVLDLHPRALVLCAGANDLSAHAPPTDTIANLTLMVGMARKQDPALPIVVCTIPPQEIAGWADVPGARQDLRTRIQAFASGKPGIAVLDLYPVFGDAAGKLVPELFNQDHVHPNADGYVKWTLALIPVLEGLGIK